MKVPLSIERLLASWILGILPISPISMLLISKANKLKNQATNRSF